MKKTLNILFVSSVLFIIGCEKTVIQETPEQVMQNRINEFKRLDQDNDSLLTEDETKDTFIKVPQIDKNNDQKISFDEYIEYLND